MTALAFSVQPLAFGWYLTNLLTVVLVGVEPTGLFLTAECVSREDTMSNRGMPRRCVPMKDVALLR